MLGLVGESGSGKTTLARAMMGLVGITGGTLRFEGQPVTSRADFVKVRQGTALMFQDAGGLAQPAPQGGGPVTEPFEINGVPLPDGAKTARRCWSASACRRRWPSAIRMSFRAGRRGACRVARALALKPKLVIADEPTAGLDVSVQAEILNLMTGLRRDMG